MILMLSAEMRRTLDAIDADDLASRRSTGASRRAVSPAELWATIETLARDLVTRSPVVLTTAKFGLRHCLEMSWDGSDDYLYAKLEQSQLVDRERGREQGLEQFCDAKAIRPGVEAYRR